MISFVNWMSREVRVAELDFIDRIHEPLLNDSRMSKSMKRHLCITFTDTIICTHTKLAKKAKIMKEKATCLIHYPCFQQTASTFPISNFHKTHRHELNQRLNWLPKMTWKQKSKSLDFMCSRHLQKSIHNIGQKARRNTHSSQST